LGAGVLAIAGLLAGTPRASALLLAVTGILALAQWLAWKPWAARRVPLLWVLYVGYLGLGLGLLAGAAQLAGYVARPAWPAHVIGVAGFSVLIIGMATRTAMGHLGRPLRADRSMVLSYALVILAALLRLAAQVPTGAALGLLHASAGAWALGFGLVLWPFWPWVILPRAAAAAQPAAARGPSRPVGPVL
ncbi:NnrS family protein, partial [Achromobacter ruhlandii]